MRQRLPYLGIMAALVARDPDNTVDANPCTM